MFFSYPNQMTSKILILIVLNISKYSNNYNIDTLLTLLPYHPSKIVTQDFHPMETNDTKFV